jgi:hypothetical protein
MTRGIHLKRLTHSDLELLGLQDSEAERAQPEGPSARPHAAFLKEVESGVARAGPPSNPVRPMDADAVAADESDSDSEDPAFDLAALTREIRLGLEETLRFLDPGSAHALASGGVPPGSASG